MMPNPNEHFDPQWEERQRRAKEGLAGMGQFIKEQATDPTNYLGLGGGMFGKALGKAAVGTWGLLNASDADAMVYGRPAKAAVEAFEAALKRFKDGGLPEAVARGNAFRETGVYKGPDGRYRGYLSDRGARMRPEAFLSGSTKLGEVLDHPELYSMFPSLRGANVRAMSPEDLKEYPGTWGLHNRLTGVISINPNITETQMLETLLHETQHKVQQITGTPGGGNIQSQLPAKFDSATNTMMMVKRNVEKQLNSLGLDPDTLKALAAEKPTADDLSKVRALRMMYGDSKIDSMAEQVKAYNKFVRKANEIKMEAHAKYSKLYGEAEARTTSNVRDKDLRAIGVDPDQMLMMDKDLKGGPPVWDY